MSRTTTPSATSSHRILLTTALSIACAVASAGLGGCATAPGTSVAVAPPDCAQLEAEQARTEAARQAAVARQHNAWKAVIPVAVAGSVAAGKQAEHDADRRLAEMKREAALRGCVPADA